MNISDPLNEAPEAELSFSVQKSEVDASLVRRITLWGMVMNLLLAAAKFAVGLAAHSQACVADAIHSLSDLSSDLAVLIGVRFWSAPADSDHPHGHQRIESLITLFIGALLGATAIGMASKAIGSLGETETTPLSSWPVLGVSLLSILTKEILYQWTVASGQACHSAALIANAWHHRSDAISSIPVALAALAARIWPELSHLDSIAAIIVICLLLRACWQIAWPCIKELSDQGLGPQELEEMRRIASAMPGVKNVHNLRTRRFGSSVLLDMHIMVDKDMTVENSHRIAEEVADEIRRKKPLVLDVLTHVEPENSVNMKDEIVRLARSVNGVRDIHSIRIRSVLNGYDVDFHVQVSPDLPVSEGHRICGEVRATLLKSPLKITGALIHLEPYYGGN